MSPTVVKFTFCLRLSTGLRLRPTCGRLSYRTFLQWDQDNRSQRENDKEGLCLIHLLNRTSSSSSDASTPNKTATIPGRQPKPSENVDADKDHESPEDDTDPDGVQDTDTDTRMPSSRPGRSVEPPLQRDSPPSSQPNVNVPPFVPPIPDPERARPQEKGSQVLDGNYGIYRGGFQGRSRGDT